MRSRLIIVGPPRPPAGVDLHGVDWRGPVESRAELAGLHETASVFVMPSLYEPLGYAFLEVMGCGLPCIGTAHCAMPEIITHGQSGLLVPRRRRSRSQARSCSCSAIHPSAKPGGANAHCAVTSRHRWSDVVDRISPALIAASNGAHRGVAASEDDLLLGT